MLHWIKDADHSEILLNLPTLPGRFRHRNTQQTLLQEVTGLCFDRITARLQLQRLERHRAELQAKLGRDVGIQVAALDYLTNLAPKGKKNLAVVDLNKLNGLLRCSSLDGKTGLYNLRTFQSVIEKEFALAKRKNKPLTIIMADIDNFKMVNDSYGHLQGDDVLHQVAKVFIDNLRAMDVAGRYGGDEFIFGLPETDMKAAIEIADRIRQSVQELFHRQTSTTISIGLATFPDHGTCLEALIEAADKALYAAKHAGRNSLKAV